MSARKPALIFILVTVLLDVLGFGLLIPVGPKLVEFIGRMDEKHAAPYVGLLAATYAAMQFLFAPSLGAISDRFGRRPVLLIAIFGSGLDYFAMALAPTLWILYLTRAINGLSGASFSVANAYIADVTPPEKRAGAYGLFGAAFGIGFILGPLLGGFLGDHDIRLPFYAAGTLTLLNWLYGLFVLPESLTPDRRAHFRLSRANPVRVFAGLRKYPMVAALFGAFFLAYIAQFGLYSTWALYMEAKFDWKPRDIGLSLFVVGLGAAVVQGGLARRLIPALGERRSLLIGLAIAVLAYAGYAAATEGWMIYAIIACASIGGISQPAAQSIITRAVQRDEQGATQGALAAFSNIATILGSLIATGIFKFSAEHLGRSLIGLHFYVGAGFALLALIASAWATRIGGGPTPITVQADRVTDPEHYSPGGLVGEKEPGTSAPS